MASLLDFLSSQGLLGSLGGGSFYNEPDEAQAAREAAAAAFRNRAGFRPPAQEPPMSAQAPIGPDPFNFMMPGYSAGASPMPGAAPVRQDPFSAVMPNATPQSPPMQTMPVSLNTPPPMPPQPPPQMPPQAPQQQEPGFGGRISMAMQGLINPSAPFTYNALRQSGVPHAQALLAATSPEFAKPTIMESGTDLLNNKSYIGINPLTLQGTPISIPGTSTGGMSDLVKMPYNFDASGKDEGFISALEKQDKITAQDVRAIVEGKMPANGRNLQNLMKLAARYDQNFSGAQDYQTRLQTAKSFAAGGKDSETVKSYNQAMVHATKVWDLIPKIEGANVGGIAGKIINGPVGEYRAATNPQFASDRREYENIVNALAGELMKASRASGHGSQEEIRAWKAGSLAANSGAEMRGAIRGGMDFLEGAMDATARKKSEGMKSQFAPLSLLSDKNASAFERIQATDESGKPMNAGAPAAPAKTPGQWQTLPNGVKIRQM